MRRCSSALLAALACTMLLTGPAVAAGAQANLEDMRLLRMPDIHGDTVVFVYAGDLWTVSSQGGEARRLTSSAGLETYPKFSPDGRWIAFSGEYDGNNDVYVMPAVGGEPRRLTYHPGTDRVIDWEPDSRRVRFQSARQSHTGRDLQLYTVDREGGLPERIILPEAGLSSWSDDGKRIAFNRISREERTWKRYKGGMAQDIWVYDFAANQTRRVTDWIGTDSFPMWRGEVIYYLSDREKDKLNIWAWHESSDQHRQVTRHDVYDVKHPSLGPDSIVYENGGWLYVLDLDRESPRPRRLEVTLRSDNVWARTSLRSVDDMLRDAHLAPDGNRVVTAARGDLFSLPAEKGPVRNLTATADIRERAPVWSPDGRTLAYLSDRSGEYEIYLRPADGSGEEKRLTSGLGGWIYSLQWSPDSKQLLASTADLRLLLVDADKGRVKTVDQGLTAPITQAAWSPGSDWVAYTRSESNGFSSLRLYEVKSGKVHPVTDDFTDEGHPCFDDEGKHLFFTSGRHLNPTIGGFDLKPIWENRDGLYLVTLRADLPHPFPPEADTVAVKSDVEDEDDDEENGKNGKGKNGKKDKAASDEPLVIDLEGLAGRMVALDVSPSNYYGLQYADGKLFYLKRPFTPGGGRGNQRASTSLEFFDLKEREEKTVLKSVNGYVLSADGKKILYREEGKLGIVEAKADQKPSEKPLRTGDMKAMVDPRAEYRQMLREAWRLQRDFFYDPDLHGVDWDQIWKRYSELLPYVSHGADFTYLVGEMISELNAGHAYARPGDRPKHPRVGTGLLGCDFALDARSGRYQFARVFTERDWNSSTDTPLSGPGRNVEAGEYLLAVDGVDLEAPRNPYSLLIDRIGEQVTLRVGPRPDGKDSREITIEPIRSEASLRYTAWVEANRRRVDELSGGRIGYLHLPNTAVGGQQGFARGYYPQLRKDALIIDERYNGGGFIPDFFMNILRQQLVNLWRPRYGEDWRTPGTAFLGHMAMISNAYAGSGGDALPYYFKAYGLGQVIGTRTWGGLVGISRGIPLIDGGNVTFPEFGIYSLDGEWVVENYGVDPDIVVDNLPHEVIDGRDPQLEKTVEVLLEQIARDPIRLPEVKRVPAGPPVMDRRDSRCR
jgi:tricorn protease